MADQPKREVWVIEAPEDGEWLPVAAFVDYEDLPATILEHERTSRYTPALHWLKPADIVGNYPKEGQAALVVPVGYKDPLFSRWQRDRWHYKDSYIRYLHMDLVERFALLELPEVKDG